jgi:hypothetical protein
MQICRWRAQVQADAVLPAYPHPHTVEERTIIKDHKKLKTWSEGRPTETPEELLNELLPHVERLRESGNSVSTELLQRPPQLLHIGFAPHCCHVLHFLKKHHYTFCVVTHQTQNH